MDQLTLAVRIDGGSATVRVWVNGTLTLERAIAPEDARRLAGEFDALPERNPVQ